MTEIVQITGWKPDTFKSYYSKGQFVDFINESENGQFEASNTLSLTSDRFQKLLSQSKNRRGIGHSGMPKIAKALLNKSKENMCLSIEVYNRPSLENRLDAFVMLFCTSWEQLLKAVIIEKYGEDSIYKPNLGKGKFRQTLSIRECIDKIYPGTSSISKNLKKIVSLRDEATHYLMPELQGIISRYFQSGIINYSSEYEKISNEQFLNVGKVGMISLVTDFRCPSISFLKTKYGNIANEIVNFCSEMENEIRTENNLEFALPLNITFGIVKKDADGILNLINSSDGVEGIKNALIVTKPISPQVSHPYREKSAINALICKLMNHFSTDEAFRHISCKDRNTGKQKITSHCFQAMLFKIGCKNANNALHFAETDPECHRYSEELIDLLFDKIIKDSNFILRSKQYYQTSKNKKHEIII